MLLVERMALSTKAHHTIVVIFMVVNLYVTFEEETVGRALVVYAIFSTFVRALTNCTDLGPDAAPTMGLSSSLPLRAPTSPHNAPARAQAYLVNLLLATRFLSVPLAVRLLMSALALVIYGGCLAVNWTWQLLFISRIVMEQPSLSLAAYLFLIVFVVWDDCLLLRWLWYNVGKTAQGLAKEESGKAKEE